MVCSQAPGPLVLAQQLMGLQVPANRRPRFSYRASCSTNRRSLDSSFARRSEPAARHQVATVCTGLLQVLRTVGLALESDHGVTTVTRYLLMLAPFWQDGQASQSLQTGGWQEFAPDTSVSEEQQRRCSLDSCLAQMHKQGILGGGTVSILLSQYAPSVL
jgi:hypothetical protein